MTPSAYAHRYHNLEAPLPDGGGVTVDIRRYLSAPDPVPPAKDHLLGYAGAQIAKFTAITLKVRTRDGVAWPTYTNRHDLDGHIANPFYGKGSPESIQIVLQLLVRDNPKLTRDQLQDFCDKNLGLDCNGFVGNYIRHEIDGHPWHSLQRPHDTTRGPSSLISDLVRRPFVAKASDLKFSEFYVMGLVDRSGEVIPGGKGPAGHIVIVEPHTLHNRPSLLAGEMCLAPGFPEDPAKTPAVNVVESTGRLGLTQSWYNLASVDRRGVFTVYRGCTRNTMPVRIAPV